MKHRKCLEQRESRNNLEIAIYTQIMCICSFFSLTILTGDKSDDSLPDLEPLPELPSFNNEEDSEG